MKLIFGLVAAFSLASCASQTPLFEFETDSALTAGDWYKLDITLISLNGDLNQAMSMPLVNGQEYAESFGQKFARVKSVSVLKEAGHHAITQLIGRADLHTTITATAKGQQNGSVILDIEIDSNTMPTANTQKVQLTNELSIDAPPPLLTEHVSGSFKLDADNSTAHIVTASWAASLTLSSIGQMAAAAR